MQWLQDENKVQWLQDQNKVQWLQDQNKVQWLQDQNKVQWLQDQNKSNVDSLKNVQLVGRHFRNKKNKEYLKARIDELETNSKIRRPSGTLAKEQGSPKLVTDYGAQRARFFIWAIKLRMRWAGHVAHVGQRRGVYRDLVGKPEGKRPPGRCRPRWEDNIKMDLQEVVAWTGRSWIRIGTGGGHL